MPVARTLVLNAGVRTPTVWPSAEVGLAFDPRGWFVYVLWGSAEDERPEYVGQSRNVISRVGAHLAGPRLRHVERVELIPVGTAAHADTLERQLIWRLQPRFNLRGL